MDTSREALLRKITPRPYPALPPLNLLLSIEVDPAVLRRIVPCQYSPGSGVNQSEGNCSFEHFLVKLRSHRYNELVIREHGQLEAPLQPSGKQLLTTLLNIVNHGNILDPDIGPLVAREEDFRNGFQVVSILALPAVYVAQTAYASENIEECDSDAPAGEDTEDEDEDKDGSQQMNFCDVFFLCSGSLDRDAWLMQIQEHRFIPGTQPAALSLEIVQQRERHGATYAVVTDGVLTLVAHVSEHPFGTYLSIEFFDQEPLQMVVAWLITRKAHNEGFCALMGGYSSFDYYLGALGSPALPLADDQDILARGSRADFDVYTMQRDRRAYDQFVTWKIAKSDIARHHPLGKDLILICDEKLSDHELNVQRSPVPFPPIPEETRLRLGCDVFRPFDAIAGQLQDRPFVFRIDTVLRAVENSYSQVFTGHAEMPGDVHSGTLCLKLYDERFFPTPEFDPPKDPFSEGSKMSEAFNVMEWTTAIDMARREEAAYDRLRGFQGSLVPYSYGIYWFRLPDGHRCIGMLLEYVEYQPLNSLPRSCYKSKKSIKSLVSDMRHAVRVLRYAQISQRDWNLGNFLCKRVSLNNADATQTDAAPVSVKRESKFSLVLIDFAFATQHMLLDPTWLSDDIAECWLRAASLLKGSKAVWWFGPDENEY